MAKMKEFESGAARQMPLYNCHKQVWALKIKSITEANKPTIAELEEILNGEQFHGDDEIVGAIVVPEDEGFAEFPVSRRYFLKHNPQSGGYYVVYKDGYKSYSPADAFEDGYSKA